MPELQFGSLDFFFFVLAVLISIFTFFCLASPCFSAYLNLTVPVPKCSTFSIAILNEICFFRSLGIDFVLDGSSAIKLNTMHYITVYSE